MSFTKDQYSQIAQGYEKASADPLVSTEKRVELAKKAEWFRFLSRTIMPGEQFLGIPFAKLKIGSFVEEKSRGKGEIVDGKKSPRVSRT